MRLNAWIGSAAVTLMLSGAAVAADPGPDLSARHFGVWGVDVSDQDRSVRPGDDFYGYQNGAWLARTDLGAQQNIAAFWRDIRLLAPRRLIALLDQAAADPALRPDSPSAKAAALYRAFLDRAGVEAKGLTPLQPDLAAIRGARSASDIARLMGEIEGPGAIRSSSLNASLQRGLFVVSIAQDRKRPDRYAVYLGQGGLQLPGPEYYSDPQLADYKTAYRAHVAKVLTLIGWPDPERRADEIVAFETRIAAVSWSHDQMLDVVNTYNPMSVRDLERLAPGFDWRAYLRGAEVGGVGRVVIDARTAFAPIADIYAHTPLDVLKARQAFAVAEHNAPQLGSALYEARFAFRIDLFRQSLQTREPHAAAERIVESVIPDTLSALYVARYSSPQVKAKVEEMAARMKTALDARLQGATWMSPQTRAAARDKAARMVIKIGYPDHLQTYDGLRITADDLFGDVRRATAYAWRRQVRRLDQPFDRSEWTLTPEYPNYAYVAQTNSLEIPASLLEAPFFDLSADPAVNYGAIGALVGQMIATGFTNQGGKFDAQGRLAPWRTPQEAARLEEMTRIVSARYSALEPIPGVHPKGDLLVDEALGDVAGLLIALDAYHASLGGAPAPILDGYTGDQRFFLGRAQMWRAKFSTGTIRNQMAVGANALPWMRVNMTLPNIDAWYDAFQVKPGDRLYLAPADRIRIW